VSRSGQEPAPSASEAWAEWLAAWAIPAEILSAAPESPWQVPPELFARRADLQIDRREGISLARAEAALGPGGSVLDVGSGAGAASLPLHGLTELAAVDVQQEMLGELLVRAGKRHLPVAAILGRWPDVALSVPEADVVVCHHVLYNVPDIAPFLRALDRHARRRVVIEITAAHPMSGLNPLWRHFHQIERPQRPTWRDAVAVLQELNLQPVVDRSRRSTAQAGAASLDALVRMTRIRLCLNPEREPEVRDALNDLGMLPHDPSTWSLVDPEVVTLWWDQK
jgi:ubiquinone/menaquinone biosynthesis C-methylase UbiE